MSIESDVQGSTTCDSYNLPVSSKKLLLQRNSNSTVLDVNTSLFHRKCYISNAFIQIIINQYRVQQSLLSILLSRLGESDCEDCKSSLISVCVEYIRRFDSFTARLNLPLQILSAIATDEALDLVKDVISSHSDEDSLYWQIALFNSPTCPGNSDVYFPLVLNHFNFKPKTKYQNVFDELSREVNPSLWIKTFNSMHELLKNGFFDDVYTRNYLEIINNFSEDSQNADLIHEIYTRIIHSIELYLSDNPCINYFNIKNLINGLIALIVKFGEMLRYKLPMAIEICRNLIPAINCNCKYISGNCISGVFIKSDAIKLSKILNVIMDSDCSDELTRKIHSLKLESSSLTHDYSFPTELSLEKVSNEKEKVSNEKEKAPNEKEKVSNVETFTDLPLEIVTSILDYAIKYVESLYEIKICLARCAEYNRRHNSARVDYLFRLLVQKYDDLNDRADINLVLDYDLLFQENGSLRNWVRSTESCDCPGE